MTKKRRTACSSGQCGQTTPTASSSSRRWQLATGNGDGWYRSIPESTALFMHRQLWNEINGYDENFQCAGGGFLTLDVYRRACELSDVCRVMLLGEATFHQFHSGATTRKFENDDHFSAFHAEYMKIRGFPFSKPDYVPQIYCPKQTLERWPEIDSSSPTAKSENSSDQEIVSGQCSYLETLLDIHNVLEPRSYLEIGVRNGGSLCLAKCASIGVDPAATVTFPLKDNTVMFNGTSDDFFLSEMSSGTIAKSDMAFIDGLHSFEQALRDFINVEKASEPHTLVIFDDIFPNHPAQANRSRTTNVWTGDVWKMLSCLKTFRPELTLLALDTSPTGLLLVTGINPQDMSLHEHFDFIVERYMTKDFLEVPPHTLARHNAVGPTDDRFYKLLRLLKSSRNDPVDVIRRRLSDWNVESWSRPIITHHQDEMALREITSNAEARLAKSCAAELSPQLTEAREGIVSLHKNYMAAKAALNAKVTSTSWRITAPLRSVAQILRHIRD